MPPSWVEKYDGLRKTEETSDTLNEGNLRVKTCDPVVQVLGTSKTEQENSNAK